MTTSLRSRSYPRAFFQHKERAVQPVEGGVNSGYGFVRQVAGIGGFEAVELKCKHAGYLNPNSRRPLTESGALRTLALCVCQGPDIGSRVSREAKGIVRGDGQWGR
jgi:hypothetical protein